MRLWTIVVVTLVIGTSTGIGLSYYEMYSAGDQFDERQGAVVVDAPQRAQLQLLDGADFSFGNLERNQQGEHRFRVKNIGTGELRLGFESVSCGKCVETSFKTLELAPNETGEIPVVYRTQKPGPKYAEFMDVWTNDLTTPVVRFNITGFVIQMVRLSVEEGLNLGSLSTNESTKSEFQVYVYQGDRLEIVGHSFQDPATADYFNVSFNSAPLPISPSPAEQPPTVAVSVKVEVKPGLPQGIVNQTLRLTAQLADRQVPIEVPIRANVTGDIMFLGGKNFDRERNLLRLGVIARGEGSTQVLRIRVKAHQQGAAEFKVAEVSPAEGLDVSLGEATALNDGAVYLIPMTIKVKADAPVMNHIGTDQGKMGFINLTSNYPNSGELRVYVSFAIQ